MAIGNGELWVIYVMCQAMRDALRSPKAYRKIADWLGFYDCTELIRAIRREAE